MIEMPGNDNNSDDSASVTVNFAAPLDIAPVSLDILKKTAAEGSWYHSWLDYSIQQLGNVQSALLAVDEDDSARLTPVAAWADKIQHAELLGDLIDEAANCAAPVVMPQTAEQDSYGIAYPIVVGERVKVVFSCIVQLTDAGSIESVMDKIEWLCLWVEYSFATDESKYKNTQLQRQKIALDGYVAVNKSQLWRESTLQWVDDLAKQFSCERVSLGFVEKDRIKHIVVSGSADHNLKSVSAKKVKLAMQECFDQKSILLWPPSESADYLITQNIEKLSSTNHSASLLTIPLSNDEKVYAVLLMERTAEAPFNSQEMEFIDSSASLVGLSLEAKYQAGVSLFGHLLRSSASQLEKLLSPGYLKRKIVLIVFTTLVLFFSFVEGNFTINSDVELEPKIIRIVAAPFAGYIKKAEIYAGDKVPAGSELVYMEDRDLRLEKIKWISQLSQDEKQYTEAIASYDRAKAQIFKAKMEQSQAQLDAVNSKLDRSVINAPFDALIVSGDLSKRVGGSVNQGEELFQLSPMDNYRLIVYVSEYKITELKLGQSGQVLFSSLPNTEFSFKVEKITPVTIVREGGTFYRVEGGIESNADLFRPGLVGVSKVHVDRRLLIDIWTYDLRKWFAIELWSLWG